MIPVVFYAYAPIRARLARMARPEERQRGGFVVALALALLSLTAQPARAVTPATLIGPELDTQTIRITGLRDGVLSYFDEQRTLRSTDVGEVVRLRSIGETEAPVQTPGPCVWLTDGQRFTGQWIGPTPDGSAVRWRHGLVGELSIPLDEVVTVVWQDDAAAPTETPVTDTLTLTNSDTLTGFVSALSEEGVLLIPDAGGEPVTIPYARIARLTLTNPAHAAGEPGHRIMLADGSRLSVQDLQLTGELAMWLMNPPGDSPRRVQAPIEEVARIDFETGGMRLVDLSELTMNVLNPPVVFGLAQPVRSSGRSIRVHAPATIEFELPQGATQFAAVAALDTRDAPERMTDWADFQVVVLSGEEEVGRVHLTASNPEEAINAPVSGRKLTIRLESGVNGPILDRLLLRDVSVLVRTPAGESTGSTGR